MPKEITILRNIHTSQYPYFAISLLRNIPTSQYPYFAISLKYSEVILIDLRRIFVFFDLATGPSFAT